MTTGRLASALAVSVERAVHLRVTLSMPVRVAVRLVGVVGV